MTDCEKHWVAGYLEGEAHFSLGTCSYGIDVSAVDLAPLKRLQILLGGRLSIRKWKTTKNNVVYRWFLTRRKGCLNVMTQILPLMSPRRQARIKQILRTALQHKEYGTGKASKLELRMYHRLRRLAQS